MLSRNSQEDGPPTILARQIGTPRRLVAGKVRYLLLPGVSTDLLVRSSNLPACPC